MSAPGLHATRIALIDFDEQYARIAGLDEKIQQQSASLENFVLEAAARTLQRIAALPVKARPPPIPKAPPSPEDIARYRAQVEASAAAHAEGRVVEAERGQVPVVQDNREATSTWATSSTRAAL